MEYFEGSLFEAVEQTAQRFPNNIACDFMGRSITYKKLIQRIETCAGALRALGIGEGDRVTIALPNCPQAVCMFYAVNLVGAIANMVHPLSAEKELAFYLKQAESTVAVTLKQLCPGFEAVCPNTGLKTILSVNLGDILPFYAHGFGLLRKKANGSNRTSVIGWHSFLRLGRQHPCTHRTKRSGNQPAVILYSGGTTGVTKGILLSNKNFNALSQQIVSANPMFRPGDKMLAALPMFHGFGLGVCIHTMLAHGGRCILLPRLIPKKFAKALVKSRCNFIAGVPTLYEALLQLPHMEKADLSCLKGVFSGGDSLSPRLKARLDQFLKDRNAAVQVREGYGTTETVTACCLTPEQVYRQGSIGLPFADNYIKIIDPNTQNELPCGETGEIWMAGPTVMLGYLHHPEETARTLIDRSDSRKWVRTGDLGSMDSDGFVYFKGRIKRMIVSSGYNIYPAQLENVLNEHPYVQTSCVIGLPDAYKMQKPKAFVKLSEGVPPTEQTRNTLMEHCRKHLAKYALPCEIEFRSQLPTTLVGKVAYRILEQEESAKAQPDAR
ncbi:MAG: AMP-binding protein [Oscillospiraceae bacterium]|nr:AMP-binding protein [Oscillospiraceae bacterium]